MERCKMRVCSCCGKQRPDKYFYKVKKGNGKSVPRSECKKCTLDKKREREREHNKEYDKWFKAIPKKCERCGETRWYMIDFHHIDPANKECEMSQIRCKSWTSDRKIATAQREMIKCIQLCSNCHREFHHLERNFGFTIDDYI